MCFEKDLAKNGYNQKFFIKGRAQNDFAFSAQSVSCAENPSKIPRHLIHRETELPEAHAHLYVRPFYIKQVSAMAVKVNLENTAQRLDNYLNVGIFFTWKGLTKAPCYRKLRKDASSATAPVI